MLLKNYSILYNSQGGKRGKYDHSNLDRKDKKTMHIYARNYTLEAFNAFRSAKLKLNQLYVSEMDYLSNRVNETYLKQRGKIKLVIS